MYMVSILIAGVLFLSFIVIAFFIPKVWYVKQTAFIHTSVEQMYDFLLCIKNWPKWQLDFEEEIAFLYVGPEKGEGSAQYWEINGVAASLRVIQCEYLRNINYQMRINHGETRLDYKLELLRAENSVTLIWSCEGISNNNPLDRYASLIYGWRVKKEMKKALVKLKEVYHAQEKIKQSA